MSSTTKTGSLVISLDFELMWGVVGCATKDGYGRTNVKQVPIVIEKILELFKKYGVHATFATVGMIMYNSRDELISDIQQTLTPSYINSELSPYENGFITEITLDEEPLFFQNALVQKISSTIGMEIGTHTYCHFYCWESGQTIEQFEEDIKKAISVAESHGLILRSIVFPRNNVSADYLDVCERYGIYSYRGNAKKFFEKPSNRFEVLKNKVYRFLDSFFSIGGMMSIPYDEIRSEQVPMNIPASRFVRPYSSRLHFLDGLKFHRIRKEMIYAAQNGELYHLWWHPHNFGMNPDENLRFLERILEVYQDCHNRYGMQSFTMDEFRNYLINNKL